MTCRHPRIILYLLNTVSILHGAKFLVIIKLFFFLVVSARGIRYFIATEKTGVFFDRMKCEEKP